MGIREKIANAVAKPVAKVCPKCWGEMHEHPCYDFFECKTHTIYHHELKTEMLVVVWDKTRHHSAVIPCGDLRLTGKMRGYVVGGPHSGMNWRRDV